MKPIRLMPMHNLKDAIGVCHKPVTSPPRIVCLVPSITELLFALGLGPYVVGRTSYCIYPVEGVAAVPSVGGTKKVKQRLLQSLQATHVIVNIDENTKAMVEQIAEYVPHIIVTHPLAPENNLELYQLLGGVFRRETEATKLCEEFTQSLTDLQQATRNWPRRDVLYLIWREPWMTVAQDTYLSRTLALVRWDTLPAVTDQRYPIVTIDPALLAKTDLVLFSTEPYSFTAADVADFAQQFDYPLSQTLLIDGEMTSWYGNRAIQGLRYLRSLATEVIAKSR